jgi:hypothetical protein
MFSSGPYAKGLVTTLWHYCEVVGLRKVETSGRKLELWVHAHEKDIRTLDSLSLLLLSFSFSSFCFPDAMRYTVFLYHILPPCSSVLI